MSLDSPKNSRCAPRVSSFCHQIYWSDEPVGAARVTCRMASSFAEWGMLTRVASFTQRHSMRDRMEIFDRELSAMTEAFEARPFWFSRVKDPHIHTLQKFSNLDPERAFGHQVATEDSFGGRSEYDAEDQFLLQNIVQTQEDLSEVIRVQSLPLREVMAGLQRVCFLTMSPHIPISTPLIGTPTP